jgi:hypothetical protein
MTHQSNGRVNIITPDICKMFSMQDRIPIDSNETDYRGAMTGNWYDTSLSDAFFSAKNIQILQNGIRAGVYERSNKQYVVGEQSRDEIMIIMRSIFLQYSKNRPTNVKTQISDLNNLVLDYAIGQVYGEAQGYIKYKYDASNMYQPIAPPTMSKTNDKQLSLKQWF